MLRAWVLLLLLANALFFAWTQRSGPPPAIGDAPVLQPQGGAALLQQHDAHTAPLMEGPEQQAPAGPEVQPGSKPEPEPPPAQTDGPTALRQCMAVGMLDTAGVVPVRAALQAWPQQDWRLLRYHLSGRWMVLWGGAGDATTLQVRQQQLQAQGIDHERLRGHPAGPGFSLGRFSSEQRAQRQQQALALQGIGDTEVVLERVAREVYTLQLPDYAAVRVRFERELRPLLQGLQLRPCTTPSR